MIHPKKVRNLPVMLDSHHTDIGLLAEGGRSSKIEICGEGDRGTSSRWATSGRAPEFPLASTLARQSIRPRVSASERDSQTAQAEYESG